MVDIQKNYKAAGNNIDQMEIKGNGTKIDGIYYLQIPQDEKLRVQNELKSQLELN
jgi:polyisoprenyl-teichoic acid--peptidoglycan teichoic acid transferase